jgi:hypothetical protein
MNKINQFDKANLAKLRGEIDTALAEVGKRYGIKLSAGNARFMADTATMKVEMSVVKDGKAVSREMETLKMYLGMIGLTEEHLGQQFVIGKKTFVLAGYKSRSTKPILIQEVATGKMYKAVEASVRMALGVTVELAPCRSNLT